MLTKHFWLGESGVLVRAIRTWAQTAIAAIGVGQTNLFTVDMKNTLALATSAAAVSILMALDRNTAAAATITVVEAAPVTQKLQAGYEGEVRRTQSRTRTTGWTSSPSWPPPQWWPSHPGSQPATTNQ